MVSQVGRVEHCCSQGKAAPFPQEILPGHAASYPPYNSQGEGCRSEKIRDRDAKAALIGDKAASALSFCLSWESSPSCYHWFSSNITIKERLGKWKS